MSNYNQRLQNFNTAIDHSREMAESTAQYVRGLKENFDDPSKSLFEKVNDSIDTTGGMITQGAELYGSYKEAQLTNWSTKRELLDLAKAKLEDSGIINAGNQIKNTVNNTPSLVTKTAQLPASLSKNDFRGQVTRVQNLDQSTQDAIKNAIKNDPIASKNPFKVTTQTEAQNIYSARQSLIDRLAQGTSQPSINPSQAVANLSNPSTISTQIQNVNNAVGATNIQPAVSNATQSTNQLSQLARAQNPYTGITSVAGRPPSPTGILPSSNLNNSGSVGQQVNNTIQSTKNDIKSGVSSVKNGLQNLAGSGSQDLNDINTGVKALGSALGENVGSDVLGGVADSLLATVPELGVGGIVTGAIGGLLQLGSQIAGLFEKKEAPKQEDLPPEPSAISVGANLSQIQN